MYRQLAQRLASTARRSISSSAVCRDEAGKGPAGESQHCIFTLMLRASMQQMKQMAKGVFAGASKHERALTAHDRAFL